APNPVHDGPEPQSRFPATIADQDLNPARLEDPELARRGLAPYGRSCAESPQKPSDRLAGLQHVLARPLVWVSKSAPPQRCGTSRITEIPHPEPVCVDQNVLRAHRRARHHRRLLAVPAYRSVRTVDCIAFLLVIPPREPVRLIRAALFVRSLPCNHIDKGAGADIDVDAGAGCRQEMHERRRVETMNAPDWCAGFCIAPEVIAATQPRLSRRRGDDVAYVASLVGPQLVGRVSEI